MALTDFVEPIRMTVRVRRSVEEAFDLFTRDVGTWWPLDRFTFGPGRSKEAHIEPFIGGRFYERFADGEEHTSGHVLVWNPPFSLTFTWQHHEWAAPTEIEVRFVAEETKVTRVELEHRAWERLGTFGRESREQYANGWPTVLGCYRDSAGAA
jgi:Activator of Hsp90 ATPase homolog 1-like protein